MRDAVVLEAQGKPTVILINDVFEPIAHATAALLALPADYVAKNVVWLPHPTSNLRPEAVTALIDARLGEIRDALLGRANGTLRPATAADARRPLEVARETMAGFALSLRADGADLELLSFEAGVLSGELRLGELTCADGSCIMPVEQLTKMVAAMVRPKLPLLRDVVLREVQLGSATESSG